MSIVTTDLFGLWSKETQGFGTAMSVRTCRLAVGFSTVGDSPSTNPGLYRKTVSIAGALGVANERLNMQAMNPGESKVIVISAGRVERNSSPRRRIAALHVNASIAHSPGTPIRPHR